MAYRTERSDSRVYRVRVDSEGKALRPNGSAWFASPIRTDGSDDASRRSRGMGAWFSAQEMLSMLTASPLLSCGYGTMCSRSDLRCPIEAPPVVFAAPGGAAHGVPGSVRPRYCGCHALP
jgi:hypothetical protein